MEIGNKIKQLRKLSGITQEQLAEKLDVSRQTISKWESGAILPDLESVVHIGKLLHMSLDDLLSEGETNVTEKGERITLEDLMKINLRNRRMTLLLTGGLIFLMVSALAAIFVTALYKTTSSMQYMLYRYIAVGEYAHVSVNYMVLLIPSIGAGIIGVILCLCYIIKIKVKKQ